MTTKPQEVSPELFFETLTAYQKSAVLKGAIDLDLFTAIAEGNTTSAEIAAARHTSPRGTRIICDYLAATGFLTKHDGIYGLTADSAAFLDSRSPMYMGGAALFLHSGMIRSAFDDV